MQLQLERQQAQAAAQHRIQARAAVRPGFSAAVGGATSTGMSNNSGLGFSSAGLSTLLDSATNGGAPASGDNSSSSSAFLLRQSSHDVDDLESDLRKANRSLFVQELLLSTLMGKSSLYDDEDGDRGGGDDDDDENKANSAKASCDHAKSD